MLLIHWVDREALLTKSRRDSGCWTRQLESTKPANWSRPDAPLTMHWQELGTWPPLTVRGSESGENRKYLTDNTKGYHDCIENVLMEHFGKSGGDLCKKKNNMSGSRSQHWLFHACSHFSLKLFSSPVHSNPIQSSPIQSNPIQSNSVQSNPIQCNPIQSVQSNPIQSNPVQSNAIQSNKHLLKD